MANPFLTGSDHSEIETAILYEKAKITDIGKAVAYTDGERLYINTEDNLYSILPCYNKDFLKWVLWHERYHIELKHHNRFFKYLKELTAEKLEDEFHVTKDEVNIIMDILVHDSLAKLFPELVEIAKVNCAQFRDSNSLKYTFKTFTLEEMLDEYSKYKHGEDGDGEGESKEEGKPSPEGKEGKTIKTPGESKDKEDDKKKDDGKSKDKEESDKKEHEEGRTDTPDRKKDRPEDDEPEVKDGERPMDEPESEHDKRDWSKLKDFDTEEFIDKATADDLDRHIAKLKRKKLKMGRLTQQLNGLATSKRTRSYRLPSVLQMGDGCIFKGKMPGKVELYLVFDASGSMGSEMDMFKEIITKSIPQALNCPCEWFAGYDYKGLCTIEPYKKEHGDGYYKGKYKDFLPIYASSGYSDDGDRTIELCWLAEQKGYSPIGVTDGGGGIYWASDKLKQLRRTILVGPNGRWLAKAREINPHIQTIDVSMDD